MCENAPVQIYFPKTFLIEKFTKYVFQRGQNFFSKKEFFIQIYPKSSTMDPYDGILKLLKILGHVFGWLFSTFCLIIFWITSVPFMIQVFYKFLLLQAAVVAFHAKMKMLMLKRNNVDLKPSENPQVVFLNDIIPAFITHPQNQIHPSTHLKIEGKILRGPLWLKNFFNFLKSYLLSKK